MTFTDLFRSTAILARVTASLADHVATQAGAPPNDDTDEEGRRLIDAEEVPAPQARRSRAAARPAQE